MLSKFKSKLFSARGGFGSEEGEEKGAPVVEKESSEVGVAGSHDLQTMASDQDDTMKWYVNCYIIMGCIEAKLLHYTDRKQVAVCGQIVAMMS